MSGVVSSMAVQFSLSYNIMKMWGSLLDDVYLLVQDFTFLHYIHCTYKQGRQYPNNILENRFMNRYIIIVILNFINIG